MEGGMPRSRNDHELVRIIVAHTKSKGIFDMVDMTRFEQLSERNRRILFLSGRNALCGPRTPWASYNREIG